MNKIFVVGARIAAGGTYMAYRLGRLLAARTGYALIDVSPAAASPALFSYASEMETVSVREMENTITADDLLIANPSFSGYFFGPRLPGRKLMYVQGFQTFAALDCHFDKYVAVSSLVQTYLRAMYNIHAPVIPPFIPLEQMPQTPSWDERPAGSMLVYVKQPDMAHHMAYHYLKQQLPHIAWPEPLDGRKLPQGEFFRRIGAARYFVNISLAEGFGLPALEAMALGATVIGLDGLAGTDYMKPGENCLVASVRDMSELPVNAARALGDAALARNIAEAGRVTAQGYSYQAFEKAWLAELSDFLN